MPATELQGRILIVDDEPALRKGCARILRSCGAEAVIADDGRDAVQRLTDADFDVALIDMVMPGYDGMTVLRKLAEAELEVVPIVMTAHATIETAIEAIKCGAFDYLPKPFVPPELIVRVQRAIRWRQLRREADTRLLELDQDKSRLRAIVNSLADGVFVVNCDGTVVLSNPAARAALLPEDCGDDAVAVEQFVPDEALLQLVRDVLGRADDDVACSFMAQVRRQERVYMARVVPIASRRGQDVGAAAVLRDVTDLMNLERAKSQFMSMVAHELKSPLAAVQGFLKVILSGQKLSPEKLEMILQRCSDRVDGMAQLVRDLLELSQADSLPTRCIEPLDLCRVAREAVEANEHAAAAHGVSVSARLPADPVVLSADYDDLFRILTNLLSNAIKYNREGGEVTVAVEAQGTCISIRVTDTGLGIPPEALDRLGEEFFRVGTPDRRGIVGTGLGLALVKRAAEAYHGRLRVQSELGVGSTFEVLFPVV